MERMGLEPDVTAVRRGFGAVRWAGRLHWIEASPSRPRLLLDGAHNAAGMRCLVEHMRRERLRPDALVFGTTSGKPVDQLLDDLGEIASTVVLTRPPVERGIETELLASEARRRFTRVESREAPAEALERGVRAGRRGRLRADHGLALPGGRSVGPARAGAGARPPSRHK